jgi:hypothetical protein
MPSVCSASDSASRSAAASAAVRVDGVRSSTHQYGGSGSFSTPSSRLASLGTWTRLGISNQLTGYQAYANHVPLEARSPARAEELEQLTRNQPVSSVEVYRWNTEIKPTDHLLQQIGRKP